MFVISRTLVTKVTFVPSAEMTFVLVVIVVTGVLSARFVVTVAAPEVMELEYAHVRTFERPGTTTFDPFAATT
jgi:hypothetical protein